MKITEKRLRSIIRCVIKESTTRFGRKAPTEMDDLLNDLGMHDEGGIYFDRVSGDFKHDLISDVENNIIIPELRDRGHLDGYLDHASHPETDYDHQLVGDAIANMSREDYMHLVDSLRRQI